MLMYDVFSWGFLKTHFMSTVNFPALTSDSNAAVMAPSGLESLGILILVSLCGVFLLPLRLWWRELYFSLSAVVFYVVGGFLLTLFAQEWSAGLFSYLLYVLAVMLLSWPGLLTIAGLLGLWYYIRFVVDDTEALDTLFTGTVSYVVSLFIFGAIISGVVLDLLFAIFDKQLRGVTGSVIWFANLLIVIKIFYNIIDNARQQAIFELPFIFKQGRSEISDWEL